jgi:hypothetical protein
MFEGDGTHRCVFRTNAYVQPNYGRIHHELRRNGVTLTLLWEEYQVEFAGQHNSPIALVFCRIQDSGFVLATSHGAGMLRCRASARSGTLQ